MLIYISLNSFHKIIQKTIIFIQQMYRNNISYIVFSYFSFRSDFENEKI